MLRAWKGGNNYTDYGELYLTDDEWEKWKALGEPIHERVVEAYKDDDKRWRYMRFRDDKDDGNHISTVESVIESISDAVSREELEQACPEIRAKWKHRHDPSRLSPAEDAAKKRRIDSISS